MAKETSLQENFSELQEAISSYVDARFNYWKITLIEKVARAGTYLFTTILVLAAATFVYLLLSLAFSFWFAENHGSLVNGILISAGVYALIVSVVVLFRRKIFANSIVKNIAEIIYEDEEKKA
jgi:ABC-type phosphate/phosphonate transport system permease subunit